MAKTESSSTKTLSEVISYFDRVGRNFDHHAVAVLKAKADKSLDSGVDKVAAFMALGIIFTYENDLVKAGYYFKNANMLMPNDAVVVKNYASHLKYFGFFDESFDVIVKFLEKNKSVFFPDAYVLALEYAMNSGQYKKAFDRLFGMLDLCDNECRERCKHKVSYMINAMTLDNEHDRTDDVNCEAIKLIYSFVGDRGYHVVDISSNILSDEFDSWISYQIGIDAVDRSVVRSLNRDLCEWMAENDHAHDLFSNGVSFTLKAC